MLTCKTIPRWFCRAPNPAALQNQPYYDDDVDDDESILLPHLCLEDNDYFEIGFQECFFFRNVLGTRNLGEILSQRDSIAMEMQVNVIIITVMMYP